MKILSLSDFHIRGTNSKYRKGSYYSDVMSKLDEVLSLAKKNKVKFILNTGDLFDTDIVSYKIIDEFIDKINKAKIVWYSVYGNHCQTNNNTQTSESSALNHIFNRCEYFKHLNFLELDDVYIKGYDYKTGIEDDKSVFLNSSSAKFKILVIHSMIVEGKSNPLFQSVGTDEITTNYDIVLSGHNHSPFIVPPFYNSGCIGRLKTNESVIKPRVLLIDIDTKKVQPIYLNVKSPEECFDLTKVNDNKELENRLSKFVDSLGNVKLSELKITDRILQFCKINKVDKEVKEEILRRV